MVTPQTSALEVRGGVAGISDIAAPEFLNLFGGRGLERRLNFKSLWLTELRWRWLCRYLWDSAGSGNFRHCACALRRKLRVPVLVQLCRRTNSAA